MLVHFIYNLLTRCTQVTYRCFLQEWIHIEIVYLSTDAFIYICAGYENHETVYFIMSFDGWSMLIAIIARLDSLGSRLMLS